MEWVFLTVAVLAGTFVFKAHCRFMTCNNLVEHWQKAAVVDIGMGYKYGLLYIFKLRKHFFENIKHFFLVTGVSAVYKQYFTVILYDCGIASARRFNQYNFRIFCHLMFTYTGRKALPF